MSNRFKVGDIITGVPDNCYSYTNKRALMLVMSANRSEMHVKILYYESSSSVVGREYTVWNDNGYFRHTTFNKFLENYPDCYKMDEDELNKLLEKYPKIEDETLVPYVLSDEMRNELIEEMKELLTKYDYHPTDDALNKILDTWCENKGNLIRLFEKHPNYNGKFQITFDHDFDRVIDYDGIYKFCDWLQSKTENFKKEIKLGEYTYDEILNKLNRLDSYLNIFDDYSFLEDLETVNGKTREEYKAERYDFRRLRDQYRNSNEITINYYHAYDKELYKSVELIDRVRNILTSKNTTHQFVNERAEDYFKHYIPNCKIKAGQKMSRAVGKILRMAGVDKLEDYNKEFAKFSDAINPLKIKRHTIISLHPVDYFTMSFGNSWSSCQTIDKKNIRRIDADHSWGGQSSSGTMSYMLDETSCIFYTVDASYDGNQLELENKINRCMFHYNDNRLLQGRVYPQSNDSGANDLYRDIREIVQKIFADILEVPNYWTNKSGISNCLEATLSYGTHYRDYGNFDNCNVSTLKDNRDWHDYIEIGHSPICPHCGKTHSRHRNIECESCNEYD